ncbi:chlorite dismutase family protein [Aquabacter spiritensis]|uniref:Chlorite dismutase n=1 Tax=Aquabacter spiritensis TaxID=933073 RepID=A0A4R3LX10_9HYPH|nr:chlorite dismutase family protein [Aquabacter spiritensis]TCT05181.1 chlorite dismutase [Aquabacter spiritensis]
MPAPLRVLFSAGHSGAWRIDRISPVIGDALPGAARLAVHTAPDMPAAMSEGAAPAWILAGTTSNLRYTTGAEADALKARQEGLGRAAATRAALIPIRKTQAWWDLAQDERRAIFEERSRHIGIGLDYLPAVARRLHHARELGEPFDFLTWFEYAPEHAGAFEDMVDKLRRTEEWRYVEREVDIRLSA